jgi:hypothetical protein
LADKNTEGKTNVSDTGKALKKQSDVGYYLETFLFLESNKISILQVVFQRLRVLLC